MCWYSYYFHICILRATFKAFSQLNFKYHIYPNIRQPPLTIFSCQENIYMKHIHTVHSIIIYRYKSIKEVNILRENMRWEVFYTCFCCWNDSFPKKGKSTAAKWGKCSCRLCSIIMFRLTLRRTGHDWSSFKLWMHASTCSPATGVLIHDFLFWQHYFLLLFFHLSGTDPSAI